MRTIRFIKKFYNFDYNFIIKRYLPTTNPISSDYLTKLRDSYRLEEDNNIVVPVFKKALLYGNTIAIKDNVCDYTYLQLYSNSKRLSRQIANLCGSGSSSTVAFFYSNDVLCTLTLWGCWMCGQVAMPLKYTPNSSLLDLLKLSNARLIIAPNKYSAQARKLAYKLDLPFLTLDHTFIKKDNRPFNYNREVFMTNKLVVLAGTLTNDFYTSFDALLLTSDLSKPNFKVKTTSLSHRNLYVQIKSICNAFQMSPEDRIYQVFPSNNISGYIIANMFPLNAGCTNQLYAPFDAPKTWSTILGINVPQKDRPNILITEPHVYNNLINEYDKVFLKNSRMVEFIKMYCMRNFRLMISSFMPLPKYVADRWCEITGHQIVDVYYVPNNGMVLYNNCGLQEANNFKSMQNQRSQLTTILPDIKLRLVSNNNDILLETDDSQIHKYRNQPIEIGNLMISSAGFREKPLYEAVAPTLANPNANVNDDANQEVHSFNTGDIAIYENGVFKIIGRNKSDLYKTDTNRLENINVLNSTLYLHPDIDFAKVENCGIVYATKPNRRMSLKSLKYFYATILKECSHATIFHLDTNDKDNNSKIESKQK